MSIPKEIPLHARAASFLAAVAIALVSGTPYLYSTYSNQLTTKLVLTAVQSNLVAGGIHYGLFLSGPIFGGLADRRGPRASGVISAALLMMGYAGLSLTYAGMFKPYGFFTAFLFLVLIGMGSQAGFMTAVSTNAHNFQSARGLAMGIPIGAFGLSALLFAQINNILFNDDTRGFLLFVSLAIGSTILVSLLFLRVFPAHHSPTEPTVNAEIAVVHPGPEPDCNTTDDVMTERRPNEPTEHDRLLPAKTTNHGSINQSTDSLHNSNSPVPPSGPALFRTNTVAQLLMISIMLLSGPGLMYVSNAGNVIRSIYRAHLDDPSVPPTDEELLQLQQLQNYHVSLISLCSCLGRVSTGLLSDMGKRGQGQWWGSRRIGFLLYAGVCVWLGQTFGANVHSISDLAVVSAFVGLGYGSVFGVAPTIVSEWFGVSHFGTNWGWISIAPALGGQVFSLIFGYLYDREAQHEHTLECFGVECFHTSFILGTLCSFTGIVVLAFISYKTRPQA